ncbi:hypothetical protein [Lactiplantibacillus plantarum]|uniref:hypothetical protein n=1 Tax=Lactiplantibacillus plantarum TaxID=1590 RepID=UPI000B02918D|nr:hypothetical protein [Lactiplantibacillus plantarum]
MKTVIKWDLPLIKDIIIKYLLKVVIASIVVAGLKSIFETDFKRHSEPRLPSTAQINH